MPNARERPDLYPVGYFEAREQCSAALLAIFDRQCPSSAPTDLWASDTPQGHAYSVCNVLMLGLPAIALAAKNLYQSHERNRLSRLLIQIANHRERLDVVEKPACVRALDDRLLEFTDVAECPIETLRVILRPEINTFLRKNKRDVSVKKAKLNADLSQYRSMNTNNDAETTRTIQEKEADINRCTTMIEQLRESGYTLNFLEYMTTQIRIERQQAHVAQWVSLVSRFETYFVAMSHRITEMQHEPEEALLIEAAQECQNTLCRAKESFMSVLQAPDAYPRIRAAAIIFAQTSAQAIATASEVLEKDTAYDWRHLFADMLNTLVFVVTLSFSYWTTGQFRLFTPKTPIAKEAYALSQDLKKQLEIYRQESESLVRQHQQPGPFF